MFMRFVLLVCLGVLAGVHASSYRRAHIEGLPLHTGRIGGTCKLSTFSLSLSLASSRVTWN